MGLLYWECTVCQCPIKSSLKLTVSYPLRMLNENEKLEKKNRLSTCTTKKSSPLKQMHNFGVGAEFVRGRDVIYLYVVSTIHMLVCSLLLIH